MTVLANAFSLNMLNKNKVLLSVEQISLDEAKTVLADGFISAIGHQDTANVLSNLLGIDVPMNRVNVVLDSSVTLVVAQYKGPRLPEGATQLPVGATIEFYTVRLVDTGNS
jgi:hypothetical protein